MRADFREDGTCRVKGCDGDPFEADAYLGFCARDYARMRACGYTATRQTRYLFEPLPPHGTIARYRSTRSPCRESCCRSAEAARSAARRAS